MKTTLPIVAVVFILLTSCSGNTESSGESMKLSLSPAEGEQLRGNYTFSVNQLRSGDVTAFTIGVNGQFGKTADGKNYLEISNEQINLEGNIKGNKISAIAGQNDTLLENDIRLVALPVFTTLGKKYRAVFDGEMNKISEVQINEGAFVDSTESRVQFLLRYPAREIKVGDSWERDIILKAGNKMNCSAIYKLEKIQGDTAFITVDGKIYGNGESFGNSVSFKGKLKGAFMVKKNFGTPFSMDVTEEFNLHMNGDTIPMIYSIKAAFESQGNPSAAGK